VRRIKTNSEVGMRNAERKNRKERSREARKPGSQEAGRPRSQEGQRVRRKKLKAENSKEQAHGTRRKWHTTIS